MRVISLLVAAAAFAVAASGPAEIARDESSVKSQEGGARDVEDIQRDAAPSCEGGADANGKSDSESLKLDNKIAERMMVSEPSLRSKVVVIGCGPGGMFFLHALATKRKKLKDAGDMSGLAAMPEVTVYEKASEPGGVWRSDNMFAGLWSNTASAELEFFDYTFEDYFGGSEPVPVFMPRAQILKYMIARVTSVEDVFQHVQFNTQVTSVVYNKNSEKFMVRTKDITTNATRVDEYDKCIWAGGPHSKAKYPFYIQDMLLRGGYTGKAMHSSELERFDSVVVGKQIILVGDNYSAEDVALQALKEGAEHVYIITLGQGGVATLTSSWPGDRVDIFVCLPTAVIHNGTGLLCSEIDPDNTIGGYAYSPIKGGEFIELENISAVIYCTGYITDMSYLAADLRKTCRADPWSVPDGWKSLPNSLEKDLGHVMPSSNLHTAHVCDEMYRYALMSNPNMMFIYTTTSSFIPDTDSIAWLLALYVSGDIVLPSLEEMKKRNFLDKMDEMNVPYIRRQIDQNYDDAISTLSRKRGHWLTTSRRDPGYDEFYAEGMRHAIKLIARNQQESGHGGDFGTYNDLSPRGEALLAQFVDEDWSRKFPIDPVESEWRTFRDLDPTPYTSLYTGAKAAPLKAHWIDLDNNGNVMVKGA